LIYQKEIINPLTNRDMIRIIAKIIHHLNPNYFPSKSYKVLDWWEIEDIYEGRLIFNP